MPGLQQLHLDLKAGRKALNMLGDSDSVCVVTPLKKKKEKESPLDERCKRRAQCTKILWETYGWASQTTAAFFCGWLIHHLMRYSSTLSLYKRSSYSQSAFINYSTLCGPWKYFEDAKFSFRTCLLLGSQTVAELMLRSAVYRLLSYFRWSTVKLNFFSWLTQNHLQPVSGNTRRSEVVWNIYYCTVILTVCRNTSVGIATRYGLDVPEWRRDFYRPRPDIPGAHPACYTTGTGSLSRR